MDMPSPHEQEEALFRAAAGIPAGTQRERFLAEACEDDKALRVRLDLIKGFAAATARRSSACVVTVVETWRRRHSLSACVR